MPSTLDDPALVQNQNKICLGHRLEVMSDQEAGLPGHESLQSLPDCHLALDIKAPHWLVQDQNGGISDKGPGNGDPLSLATRESVTSLADDGVVPLFKLEDKVMGVGRLGRRNDFLHGG